MEGFAHTESVTKGVFLFGHASVPEPHRRTSKRRREAEPSLPPQEHVRQEQADRLVPESTFEPTFEGEPEYAVQARHRAFVKCWEHQECSIAKLLASQNEKIFGDIVSFTNVGLHGAGRYTSPLPEVPTAALLMGINSPDHARMFTELVKYLRKHLTPYIARLRSTDCKTFAATLRTLCDRIVRDENGHIPEASAQYTIGRDLKSLQRWYSMVEEDSSMTLGVPAEDEAGLITAKYPRPVIVVIEDFESFDSEVLSDLIVSSSHYRDSLPITIILGVASAASAIPKLLSRRAMMVMNIAKFKARVSSSTLDEIVQAHLLVSPMPFRLGHKSLQILLDGFLFHHLSVSTFVRGMRFAMLHHFSQNPLSALVECCWQIDKDSEALCIQDTVPVAAIADLAAHVEKLRQTPAFRPIVHEHDGNPDLQKRFFLDDAFVISKLRESLTKSRQREVLFGAAVLCLRTVCAEIPEEHRKLSTFLLSLLALCLKGDFTKSDDYIQLLVMLNAMSLEQLSAVLKGCSDVLSFTSKTLVGTIRAPAAETLLQYAAEFRQLEADMASGKFDGLDRSLAGSVSATTADSTMDDSNFDSIGKRRRLLLRGNSSTSTPTEPVQKDKEIVVKKLSEFFEENLNPTHASDWSSAVVCGGFSSSSTTTLECNMEDSIKNYLEGQSREALQNALALPEKYLGLPKKNKNLHKQRNGKKKLKLVGLETPDTAILYKLHCECTKLINLYDLLESFAAAVAPNSPKADKLVQARFLRALAELQFLGYVKPTKRKADHVERLTSVR